MNKTLFLCLALLSLFSCVNRNPNLPKKQFQAALDSLQIIEQSYLPSGSSSYDPKNIPEGTRYFPVRQKNPPPIRIDFVEGINHVKETPLSEIASEILHVKLEYQTWMQFPISDISLTDEGFLVRGRLDGFSLFDFDGKFIRQIISTKHNAHFPRPGRKIFTWDEFEGVTDGWYNPATHQLMCFAMSYDGKTFRQPNTGFAIVEMNQISTGEIPSIGLSEKQIPLSGLGITHLSEKMPLGFGNGFAVIHFETPSGKECITFGLYGDTLCRFPIHSEIERPYKDKSANIPPAEAHYYYNNTYTFRYLYNDTVFRIPAPNVIQPAYIFDFGKYRLTPQAVFERPNELMDYMMCSAVCEDNQYIYVRFCKGLNSPNNREKGKVKFWWGLYHKSSGRFSVLPINTSDPDKGGITNDLDGGMPFWPQSVDAQGRKIALTRGEVIRKTLTNDWFARSKAADPEKKDQLKRMVNTLTDDDWVVTVVR